MRLPTQLLLIAATTTAAPYADLTYDAMRSEVIALAREQPRFVRLFTGREAYGDLANVIGGRCSAKHACEHFVLVLTEFASLPPHQAGAGRSTEEGRREDPVELRRPTNTSSRAEVFLSGALHGDERVGPLATLATIKLIARASACYADKQSAENCPHLTPGERASFGQGPLAAKRLAWLAHLSKTRIVYALPATNPWGFANRKRTEVRIDTNRDFAIDTSPSACAQSATGRVVNELFRRHVFQVGITFHGGMEAIAYEWGAPTYNQVRRFHSHRKLMAPPKDLAPDDASQVSMSQAMVTMAGEGLGIRPYRKSRMNSIVYPVHGGMEDWAYAASWDPALAVKGGCSVKNYERSRTASYDDASNRCSMLLVETSNAKAGPPSLFGAEDKLFDMGPGHVTRNVRLALVAIDIVEPYVTWRDASVEGCVLRSSSTDLKFSVGGSAKVESSTIYWGCYDAYAKSVCSVEKLLARAHKTTNDETASPARWGHADAVDALGSDDKSVRRVAFDAAEARQKCGGDDIWVVAGVRVDGAWGRAPPGARPAGFPPQTHLARARTDAGWRKLGANGRFVIGRTEWFTDVLVVSPRQRRRRAGRRPRLFFG